MHAEKFSVKYNIDQGLFVGDWNYDMSCELLHIVQVQDHLCTLAN